MPIKKKKIKYLYFQNPDVPPPARRFRQGDGRFDAPPDWAESLGGEIPGYRLWAVRPAPTCPDCTGLRAPTNGDT